MKRLLKHRVWSLLISVTLLLPVLTSCGTDEAPNGAQQTDSQTEGDGMELLGEPAEDEIVGLVGTPDFLAYLDYVEDTGEAINLEFIFRATDKTFASNADESMLSFDGDLAALTNASFTVDSEDNTSSLLTAQLVGDGYDAENLSLFGTITLKGEALLDQDGNPLADSRSFSNQFNFSSLDRATGGNETGTNWTASENCINLIAKFSGCLLEAYKVSGVWTIGYGHTAGVKEGDKIATPDEARELLKADVKKYGEYINKLVANGDIGFELTQNQFDALVSICSDIGTAQLQRLVKGHDAAAIAEEILTYNKKDGKALAGLTLRRRTERDLFLGIY